MAAKIEQMAEHVRTLEKQLRAIQVETRGFTGDDLAGRRLTSTASGIGGELDGADAKALRETMDQLKNKLKSAVIVLGSVDGDKGNWQPVSSDLVGVSSG